MRNEGIVVTRRESRAIQYRIADPRIGRLVVIPCELHCKQAKVGKST